MSIPEDQRKYLVRGPSDFGMSANRNVAVAHCRRFALMTPPDSEGPVTAEVYVVHHFTRLGPGGDFEYPPGMDPEPAGEITLYIGKKAEDLSHGDVIYDGIDFRTVKLRTTKYGRLWVIHESGDKMCPDPDELFGVIPG